VIESRRFGPVVPCAWQQVQVHAALDPGHNQPPIILEMMTGWDRGTEKKLCFAMWLYSDVIAVVSVARVIGSHSLLFDSPTPVNFLLFVLWRRNIRLTDVTESADVLGRRVWA